MQLLHSKLEPPRRPGIMHRERLSGLFENVLEKKLVTVVAGAGFGKTTLMIDVLSRLDVLPAWYRMDGQDTDFHVFISYFYALINRISHAADSSGKLCPLPDFRMKDHTRILVDAMAYVEKKIVSPTVIVFDDYHLVQESRDVNEAVQFFLKWLPACIQLVIIGRRRLPFELSGFRAREQIIEISEKELSFTTPEIQSFFGTQSRLANEDLNAIYETGRGWAAGLVLLRYAVAQNTSGNFSACVRQFKKRPGHIFSYLKENIFDPQPDKIRKFMMKTALLSEIDAQLCARIFGIKDARQILSRMADDHLFIFPGDDSGNMFYLHHLFQDFLVSQLDRNFTDTEIRELHCRIARVLEPDDIFAALDHYIKGHNFDQAVCLIKAGEMQFMLGGKINFLGQRIRSLPPFLLEKHPELLISLSRLYSHYGNPEKAIDLILNALKLFRQQQAKEEMVTCVVELASQYYYSGHLKEARLMMEQVLPDIPKDTQTYVIAMTYLTFLCSVLGDMHASCEHDRDAREAIAQYPDFEKQIAILLIDISRTHTLYFSGDFEPSQALCHTLLEKVTALDILSCLPLVYYQLSANAYLLGEFEKGVDYAGLGIETCEKIALSDSRKAWVFISGAQNSIGLGNLDDALEKINQATRLFEEPGNRWGLASVWECLATVFLAQKRPAKARKVLEKALSIISGYGLTITKGILQNTYARALLDENQWAGALERLCAAAPFFKDAVFHRFNNHLLAARAQAGTGNINDAFTCLQKALDLSATHSYDRFVRQEKKWILPLFEKYFSGIYRFPPQTRSYAESLFDIQFSKGLEKIKICLFGKFELDIDGRDLSPSDFKNTKALMLLKYLAAHRSRGYIHREILIEMLWPEQDPQKTSARFNMAMSALRKLLEPGLAPKAASAYIDRRKDEYRLFDDDRVIIDAETFSSLLARGRKNGKDLKKALHFYLDAIEVHRGEFLEEDRFEQWCIEKRDFFSREYRAAIEAVINIFEQNRDWDKAIFYTEILLEDDPMDEAAVERLMRFFSKTGRLSGIRNIYNAYSKAAVKSDCPVSEKVTTAYHNLVRI